MTHLTGKIETKAHSTVELEKGLISQSIVNHSELYNFLKYEVEIFLPPKEYC